MRLFIEYFKDVVSVITALLFQAPNERFDRMNGLNTDSFEGLKGKEGIVIETVSKDSGRVRYSGVDWKAILQDDDEAKFIKEGTKVTLVAVNGTTLHVTENTK